MKALFWILVHSNFLINNFFNSNNSSIFVFTMKVESVKLVSPNKRERISGGVYIEFKSADNAKRGDYFKVVVNGSNHEFEASEIQIEGTDSQRSWLLG